MRRLYQILLCLIGTIALSQGADNTAEIHRLVPSSFTTAPKRVIEWLLKEGCSVPQPEVPDYHPLSPHNLISGEFAAKGQKDWAALCSRNGSSAIKVLWGGKAQCSDQVNEKNDSIDMQTDVGDKFVYSRMISPIGRQKILKRQKGAGGKIPSALNHQGIDDIFVGKASVTHYCYQGKWLTLQGAD